MDNEDEKYIKANFTPIAVTFETIDKLTRLKEMDALALYMAYSAVCHWQGTYQPRATNLFMLQRTGWTEKRFLKAKKVLKVFGLIETVKRKKNGLVVGWYIKINHLMLKPEPTISTALEKPDSGKTTPQVLLTNNLSPFNVQKEGNFFQKSLSYEEIEKQTYNTKQKIYKKLGINWKPSKKTTKQEQTVKALLLLDYFRDKVREIQGKTFLSHPKDKNLKMQKLAINFYDRCNKDEKKAKEIIDWYCFNYGSWAEYEPSACFTNKTVSIFENKDLTSKVLKF